MGRFQNAESTMQSLEQTRRADARSSRRLAEVDPAIADAVQRESRRQRQGIQLIASENQASSAVMEAVGSCLTNKYAEGYPGKRYYGGCEIVDEVERLAISRAQAMFSTDYHVNVQPHSGTQANLAVYLSVLKPGDPILALDLNMGGHLSHGFKNNESGRLYKPQFYAVDRATERLDYDAVAAIAAEAKPRLIVVGASAYSQKIDFSKFAEIAKSVGALLHADIAHIAGLVAAGLHPTPFGHADFVTSTTHKTLRGPRGGLILCRPDLGKKLDSAVFPGMQGGPLMHVIAGKAVAFHEAMQPEFRAYQEQVVANAHALAAGMKERGLRLVAGGTENHLVLVDVRARMTGAEAEERLRLQSIYVNKNLIPYDQESSGTTSGIRMGSPAMTTRGLDEADFREIAALVADVLDGRTDGVKDRVAALCA
jgi:glycine hydroxymethyltransferase